MEGSPVLVRAAWLCPIGAPPMAGGWVLLDGERVVALGRGEAPPAVREVDLGEVALLPGLVNAHTHLELSWLRGQVPPTADFLTWVGGLMAKRTRLECEDDAAAMQAMREALAEMQRTGTVIVGDISNALVSPRLLAERGVPAVVFHELLGFAVRDGEARVAEGATRRAALSTGSVRVVPAAHAPFSVSRELFTAVRDAVAGDGVGVTSVHVGEGREELQLLREGTGPWRTRLEALGAWRDDWTPPGCGPADYLCDLGVIQRGTLVVHGVQLTDAELDRLAAVGATLVTCPRSNVWVGAGAPPIARVLASGVRVAVGTDSLASAPDLNLFEELAALRRLAPEVPARRLLRMATVDGARALGFDDHGTVAPGASARLIAVDLPAGTANPEEALVGGVTGDRVRLLSFASVEAHR